MYYWGLHLTIAFAKSLTTVFFPAGTINLSACQDVGTIQGRGQYYSAVKCMQSRVLVHMFSVDLTILGHMHAVFYIQY